MPATGSNPPASLSDHMSDDLFDYDVEIPDIVIPTNAPAPPPNSEKKDSLGIDEEVKIKKKRVGVKLDEARLMSDLGIPKLRQDAPKKIKFRGKGHEYRDAARLLSYYQFWADDLYKKAKFRDTLKIIEKLGHSRSMRDQRLSWIEETKRKEKLSRAGDNDAGADVTGEKEEPQKDDGVFEDDQNDDDLYSFPQQLTTRIIAQSSATGEAHASSPRPLFLPGGLDDSDDDDFGVGLNDDELDTLMDIERAVVSAGASTKPPAEPEKIAGMNATTAISTAPPEDDFEDEIEAMADFGPPPEW